MTAATLLPDLMAEMRLASSTPTPSTDEGFVTPPTRAESPQPSRASPSLPTSQDIIIAVMGITGCGKTSFVNLFADKQLEVGHTLDSCTQSVEIAACTMEDKTTIWLVDTPGFDDTTRSDTEILREVSAWLINAYKSDIKLAGIIYLHRIQDTRIGGTGTRNLRMFRKLCGDNNLGSVVLATTMWDLCDRKRAMDREAELQNDDKLWAPMIREGSKVLRQDKGKTSGQVIINHLISRRKKMTLEIQRELVDRKMRLEETGAGSELASVLEQLLKSYEKRIKEVENELKSELEKRDADAREMLEDTRAEWREKFNKADAELQMLRADQEQLRAEERQRYEQLEQQLRAKHAEELKDQRKQMKANYVKGMHDPCIMM